jgi:hypothetical protein
MKLQYLLDLTDQHVPDQSRTDPKILINTRQVCEKLDQFNYFPRSEGWGENIDLFNN